MVPHLWVWNCIHLRSTHQIFRRSLCCIRSRDINLWSIGIYYKLYDGKIFHARWWDYSTKKFNLNGRICADTLLPFGLLGLLLVYVITPVMFSCFDHLSEKAIQITCFSLISIFVADIIVSTITLIKIRIHAGKLNGDSTERITNEVRAVLAEKSALVRRTMKAFPEAKLYNRKILVIMRERRLQIQKDIKIAKEKTRQRIQNHYD